MPVTPAEKKKLKQRAHALKPVVMIGGKGLTDAVLAELAIALDHHELIKIRVSGADREARDAMIEKACSASGAELLQRVGHVATLWKPRED